MTKKKTKKLPQYLIDSQEFHELLLETLTKNKKLKRAWDKLDFMEIDPGSFQDDLMDDFMMAYEGKK